MEHPSIMFPAKNGLITCLRLSALVLTSLLVGCSHNPGANKNYAPTPVATPSGSSSLEPGAGSDDSSGRNPPALQLISQTIPFAADHPEQYTVQEGDTLWDIASIFLSDPWYWPEVWYVNPQVDNPHLIYPGDVLSLVDVGGQQRIMNSPVSAYRFSPQARITPIDEAVQSIPYEQIAAFLSKGLVLEKSQVEQLPYVLAVRGDHLIGAAGNEIYVRGGTPAATGTRFSVVHIGEKLVDPDDGKVVGYQGIYVGEGALARGGDPSTVTLSQTNREVLAGDRLVPETVDIPLNFFPKAPDFEVDGRIISVVDGVSLIGQYQVVVMNLGARNGLAPGDVLTVFQEGAVIRDRYSNRSFVSKRSLFAGEKVKLPDEEAGTVMVFKVYDRIGYGLVMEATDAIRVLDAVRNPN